MELSSKNKTILCVSDPHQEIDKLEYILKKENYDVVVCLGDFFDSLDFNSDYDVIKTCNFIKKYIFEPNFFTTISNHDINYLWENPTTICSGYTKEKDKLIKKEFGNFLVTIREKFLWYLWIDDRFCSHAGIHPNWLPPNFIVNKDNIIKWLDQQISFAEPALINGCRHWIYGAGKGRGGYQKVGGLTWNCFDSCHEPIEELSQIMGHTSHPSILGHKNCGSLDLTDGQDLDIDCHLAEYLIINNGKIQIKKFSDL